MPPSPYLIAIVIAFVTFARCMMAEEPPERPASLSCDDPIADLGILKSADDGIGSVSHSFVLRNNTDQLIKIKRILISCSCTTVEAPSEVPPQSEVEVKVVLELSSEAFDKRSVELAVETMDLSQRPLLLKITARSEFAAYIIPAVIQIGDVERNSEAFASFYVCMPSKELLSEFVVDAGSEVSEATVVIDWQRGEKRSGKEGENFYFYVAGGHIKYTPSSPDAKDGNVRISLSNGKVMLVPLSIGRVKNAAFDMDNFIFVRQRERVKQSTRLTYYPSIGGEVDSVVVTGAGLKIGEIDKRAGEVQITIQYDGGDDPNAQTGELVVRSRNGQKSVLPINIIGG